MFDTCSCELGFGVQITIRLHTEMSRFLTLVLHHIAITTPGLLCPTRKAAAEIPWDLLSVCAEHVHQHPAGIQGALEPFSKLALFYKQAITVPLDWRVSYAVPSPTSTLPLASCVSKGLVVVSVHLEEVSMCIYKAQVPTLWSKVCTGWRGNVGCSLHARGGGTWWTVYIWRMRVFRLSQFELCQCRVHLAGLIHQWQALNCTHAHFMCTYIMKKGLYCLPVYTELRTYCFPTSAVPWCRPMPLLLGHGTS